MNDKKIKEQLQQENIIVPESLHPEQMRKKLEQQKEANTTSSSLHPTHAVNWKKTYGTACCNRSYLSGMYAGI